MKSAPRLTVIGSADAFNSAGRGHSCYWLDGAAHDDRALMIDFGPTALAGLKRAGRDPLQLGAVVFTHLHGDHVGGVPFLLIDGLYSSPRSGVLELAGPIQLRQKAEDLVRVSYEDIVARERPFELRFQELAPGARAEVLASRIDTFAALHMEPPQQPLCLRVTLPTGQIVAFSGDTSMCDGLRAAASGADLLVAECTAVRPPAGKHCTWDDWRSELATIGAKRVLLTHLNTEVRAAVPRLLAEAPPGVDLAFADDGLIIEL